MALGHRQLCRSWRACGRAIASLWQVAKQTIAGVKVRRITHTGAAYLIDATGHERALFLYPFTTGDVVERGTEAPRRLIHPDAGHGSTRLVPQHHLDTSLCGHPGTCCKVSLTTRWHRASRAEKG